MSYFEQKGGLKMSKSIDVVQIANQIKRELNINLENDLTEIIQRVASGNLSKDEAIAKTVAALRNNIEIFVVALIQRVIDEMNQAD